MSIKVVEIFCRHYPLHAGLHQFILFTCKDLATSDRGQHEESSPMKIKWIKWCVVPLTFILWDRRVLECEML